MRLQYIHSIKIYRALILLEQLVQSGNLPPKGRSRVTAEDQNDRLARPQGRQLHGSFSTHRLQGKVRGVIADAQISLSRLCPHCLEGEEEVCGHGHFRHHMSEDFRRLMHGPVNISYKNDPRGYQKCQCDHQPTFCNFSHRHRSKSLRQGVHLQISLRRNAESICNAIKEREHGRDIYGFRNLLFRPTMIPQSLYVLMRRVVCRLRNFLHIIQKRAFRIAQTSFVQLARSDGLYRFLFCSLNPQEVSM